MRWRSARESASPRKTLTAHRFRRLARKLQKKHDCPYTDTLVDCDAVHERADFEERLQAKKAEGLSFGDALIALVHEEYVWEDEP